MAVKTLTIKELVYNELLELKAPKESFSDLFERLAKKEKGKKPDIMSFAGMLSEAEGKGIAKEARKYREKLNRNYEERKAAIEKRWH